MMFFYDIQIHLFVRSASNKVESRKSPTIFWQQRFKRAQSGEMRLAKRNAKHSKNSDFHTAYSLLNSMQRQHCSS